MRQLGGQVGEHELDALELDDLPARLPALVDVGDRVLERGARDAQRMRGDAGPRLVERREQDLQPVARRCPAGWRAARGSRRRRASPCSRRGAPSCPRCAPPTGPACPSPAPAPRSRSCASSISLHLPNSSIQIGDVAVGDEGLAAVDDDVVAVRREARSSCRSRRSRRSGSVIASDAEPAFGDARQQALLLLLGAEVDQRLHARGSWSPR